MKNSAKKIHDLGSWRICRCHNLAESYSAITAVEILVNGGLINL